MSNKNIDTQWLSARQVLLLAPRGSDLCRQVDQVLRPPHYVVATTEDPAAVLRSMADRKIEVVLIEPEAGRTRSPDLLDRLHDADPSTQIVVLAPRTTLMATVMTLRGKREATGAEIRPFAVFGLPMSASELIEVVEQAREIRYLRRADERGRRAEARMSAMIRSAPNGIVSLDTDGLVHDWNPGAEAIWGWSAAEAVGRPFWNFAIARYPSGIREEVSPVRAVRVEITGRRRDQSEFPAVLSLSAAEMVERVMYCAIVEDVTEARRLEVELRQSQKMEAVGRLASGLAHEINTPCQFMASQVQFLTEGFATLEQLLATYAELRHRAASDANLVEVVASVDAAEAAADLPFLREQAPPALASIGDGVRRISRIIGAMKDFARPDDHTWRPIDLNQSLMNTLLVLENETSAVAEVLTDYGSVPLVCGYADDLNQAFFQILLNAVHAVADRRGDGQERGQIGVRTRAEADTVIVDISDTGVGIPEAIEGKIFDPFFTTKEVGRGSGQGLPVARSIVVDRHGGAVTFESQVGAGTTFHIRLPVAR
jgi:PAS domain S-box-containing protein